MRRAVRALIRIIASALLLFGVLSVGLELSRYAMKKPGTGFWPWVIGAILLAAGVVLFMASASLAEQLTDDVDDDDDEPANHDEGK
jgi:hypothetical protein